MDPLFPHLPQVPHFLEVSHVAFRLCFSQEFVRRLIREKKLAAIRVGQRWRIDPLDLQAFIDAQRVAVGQAERDLDRRLRGAGKRATQAQGDSQT